LSPAHPPWAGDGPNIASQIIKQVAQMITRGRKADFRSLPGQSEFVMICRLSEYLCREHRHSLKKLLDLVEKNILLNVLHRVNGNQRDAGRILGLKSTTLNAKMKKHGIRVIRQIDVNSPPHDPPADGSASGIVVPPTSVEPDRAGLDQTDRSGLLGIVGHNYR
jgi:hypothetical protein